MELQYQAMSDDAHLLQSFVAAAGSAYPSLVRHCTPLPSYNYT
jgi:hypothetical protein